MSSWQDIHITTQRMIIVPIKRRRHNHDLFSARNTGSQITRRPDSGRLVFEGEGRRL